MKDILTTKIRRKLFDKLKKIHYCDYMRYRNGQWRLVCRTTLTELSDINSLIYNTWIKYDEYKHEE